MLLFLIVVKLKKIVNSVIMNNLRMNTEQLSVNCFTYYQNFLKGSVYRKIDFG